MLLFARNCMHICTHKRYIYVYTCLYIHTSTYIYIYTYTHIHSLASAFVYSHSHPHICPPINSHLHLPFHAFVCMHAHLQVAAFICMLMCSSCMSPHPHVFAATCVPRSHMCTSDGHHDDCPKMTDVLRARCRATRFHVFAHTALRRDAHGHTLSMFDGGRHQLDVMGRWKSSDGPDDDVARRQIG